jgi:hypothetical protein
MQEPAFELGEPVRSGEPPLGPGAPPRDRLMAFLAAVVEVVGRNKGLMAVLGAEVAPMPKPTTARPASTRSTSRGTPTSWHC